MEERKKPVLTGLTLVLLGTLAAFLYSNHSKTEARQKRISDQTEAVNNARQMGFALHEFVTEYGRFPDAKTAAMLREKGKTAWKTEGSSSNDWLRQLVASGHVKDERIFYARTAFSKEPDGKTIPPDKALAAGEVGFGYVMNGNTGFDTKGNPVYPLLVAPLAFDGTFVSNKYFDSEAFNHKAVILRKDDSVTSVPILKKTKEAMLGGGKSLLETGPDTIWDDKVTPVIVPPLPKP